MEFKILSHACLLVKSETHSVIIDPWLVGSCYWRSWWNFPKASFDETELAAVDAVVISHVHWDHWHGPTLKRWFRDKLVVVPDEPSMRSRLDLASIGVKGVIALPHGRSMNIGDIEITLHQFGLFLNDAAVVIRTGGVTILDANDAKIAGWSLESLVRQHGPIDFALRSHSSANPRINFAVTGQETDYAADDRGHYFRSFKLFMDAVAPRYAIPFASNHCHLHDDVNHLNSYISNPLQLRDYCREQAGSNGPWELRVMLPGSVWNSRTGFSLATEDEFADLEGSIRDYRAAVSSTLERNRALESTTRVPEKTFDRLLEQLSAKPFWQRPFADFVMTLTWPEGDRKESYVISSRKRSWEPVSATDQPQLGLPMMIMPAIVFRDAVWKRMFHHAGISKRCRFLGASVGDLKQLRRVFGYLESVELGVYPVTLAYWGRMARAYVARWREVSVYAKAAWLIAVSRKPLYLVEEMILVRTSRPVQGRQEQ